MLTNVQIVNERMRAEYATYPRPFLAWVCDVHGLSVRKFAEIFGISASHAADLMDHRKFPSLELGVRISRYFECAVEDLFGWRVDDDGSRRPLLVELPGLGMVRLRDRTAGHKAIPLAQEVAECLREGKVFTLGCGYTKLAIMREKGVYGQSKPRSISGSL